MKNNKWIFILFLIFFAGLSSDVIFASKNEELNLDEYFYNDVEVNYEDLEAGQNKIIIDDIYYSINFANHTVKVLGRDEENDDMSIEIPEYVLYNREIYRVTEIANEAFLNDCNLLEVKFDGYIDKIGDRAFKKTNLTHIYMRQGVGKVGEDAFSNIPCYAQFIVPEGKSEEYEIKIKKKIKGIKYHYIYAGEKEEYEYEYDLFIEANSKEIAEKYRNNF